MTQDTLVASKEYYEQHLLYANAPAGLRVIKILFSFAAFYCRVLYPDGCCWRWDRRMERIRFYWLDHIRCDCVRGGGVCSRVLRPQTYSKYRLHCLSCNYFFAQDAIIAIVYAVVFAVAVLICIIFAAITTVTAAKGLLAAGVVSTTLYCCFHSTYLCCYRYLVLYVVVLLVPVQHLLFTHGVHTKEEPKDLVPSFSYSHYQHKIIIQTQ